MKKAIKCRLWRKLILIISIAVFAVLGAACSSCKSNGNSNASITVNENKTANQNVEYNPNLVCGEDVVLISVEVVSEKGVKMSLSEMYAFTPTEIGNYYYTIHYSVDKTEYVYEFTVLCLDTVAPTLVSKPTEVKTIEAGLYSGFAEDLDEIVFTDNNPAAIAHIQKKVVAIKLDGREIANSVTGFSSYVFTKIGTYEIVVSASDLSGNTSSVTYSVAVADTVAPILMMPKISYAWSVNGTATLPIPTVKENFNYTLRATVSKNGMPLTITNNQVAATVGDVLAVEYNAQDENGNVSSPVQTQVKVLEYGSLLQSTDEGVAEFFQSQGSAISDGEQGVLISNTSTESLVRFVHNQAQFNNLAPFKGVEFTVFTHNAEGTMSVSLITEGTEISIGKFTVTKENRTVYLDLSKVKDKQIEGWQFSFETTQNVMISINAIRLVEYKNPYFSLTKTALTTKVGEALSLANIENNNLDVVGDIYVNIKKGATVIAVSKPSEYYIFTESGEYVLEYVYEDESISLTNSIQVTVNGAAPILTVGQFPSGVYGQSYTLPQATVSQGSFTVTLVSKDTQMPITDNSFIPSMEQSFAEGIIRLQYNSSDGALLGVYDIAMEQPNVWGFERADALENDKQYGNGLTIEDNRQVVASGKSAAKAVLAGNSLSGLSLTNGYTISQKANFITMSVYANRAGSIRIGLTFKDADTEHKTADIVLERGENTISFFINANNVTDDFNGKQIQNIIVYNSESYDNIVYLDDITFIENNAVQVFSNATVTETEIRYGEEFIIPNIIACDLRLIKTCEITVGDATYELGDKLILPETNGAARNYVLKYTIVDVFGTEHSHNLILRTQENVLSAKLKLGNYWVGDKISLPQAEVYSHKYPNLKSSDVETKKFYRFEDGQEWLQTDGNITISRTGYMYVMYTLQYKDVVTTVYDYTYIHMAEVTYDFEKFSDGEHLGLGDRVTGSIERSYVAASDVWSADGDYSLYINATFHGRDACGIEWGTPTVGADGILGTEDDGWLRAYNELGYTANGLVFWAYTDRVTAKCTLKITTSSGRISLDLVLAQGAHRYVYELPYNITNCGGITFETYVSNHFYIDNIALVNLGEAKFPDISGGMYLSNQEIELACPYIKNPSNLTFDAETKKEAVYSVSLDDGKGRYESVKEYIYPENGTLRLNLPVGKYKATFKIIIGGMEYTNEQELYVRGFNLTVTPPRSAFENGVEYQINMPTSILAGVTHEAYYRLGAETEWIKLSVKNGKALVCLTQDGEGELKFISRYNGITEENMFSIVVRAKAMIADLEINEDGTHHGATGINGMLSVSDEWSQDGKYSLYLYTEGHDNGAISFEGADGKQKLVMNQSYNAVSIWIKSEADQKMDMVLKLFYYGADKRYTLESQPVKIVAGVHQYVFVFNKSFDNICRLYFECHYSKFNKIYLDSICAAKVDITAQGLSGFAPINQAYVLKDLAVTGLDNQALEFTVVYKYVGEEEYTTATNTNGEYLLQMAGKGTVELLITAKTATGCEFTKTLQITVYDPAEDSYNFDIEWEPK